MKQNLFLAIVCLCAAVACQQPEKPAETAATPATEPMPEFAYTIDHPADYWVPGKLAHVSTVLKALKAYETGNIAECVIHFGDSVLLEFDGFEQKLSNDSLTAFFTNGRSQYAAIEVKMNDWESVISKDGKKEYVSLWYTEKYTDKKGKVDSLEIMDDLEIKDGKIIMLNEKSRKFPVKK